MSKEIEIPLKITNKGNEDSEYHTYRINAVLCHAKEDRTDLAYMYTEQGNEIDPKSEAGKLIHIDNFKNFFSWDEGKKTVTVHPGTSKEVPIKLEIDNKAPPGQYYLRITAVLEDENSEPIKSSIVRTVFDFTIVSKKLNEKEITTMNTEIEDVKTTYLDTLNSNVNPETFSKYVVDLLQKPKSVKIDEILDIQRKAATTYSNLSAEEQKGFEEPYRKMNENFDKIKDPKQVTKNILDEMKEHERHGQESFVLYKGKINPEAFKNPQNVVDVQQIVNKHFTNPLKLCLQYAKAFLQKYLQRFQKQ